MNEEEKEVYKYALGYFGTQNQIYKTIEECSELIRALVRSDLENILEELADVQIMLHQMNLLYGEKKIHKKKKEKTLRLAQTIYEDLITKVKN